MAGAGAGMSVLDFLSPGLADGGALARSSMERRQRDAGATFAEREGWLVPVALPGEQEHLAAVGVADLSHLAKLELRTDPSQPGWTSLDATEGGLWYRVSPRRVLVLGLTAGAAAVRERLAAEAPVRLALDVTAQLGVLALAGPGAALLLRRLTHLHHFPSGGEVAHVTAHVLQRGDGYWIVFPQEYGHYLWEVAVDRAQPLGGGPVGVDALPAEVGR